MLGLTRPRLDLNESASGGGAPETVATGARSFRVRSDCRSSGIAVIAVILLALPLREYLASTLEINTASDKMAEQQARVDELQKSKLTSGRRTTLFVAKLARGSTSCFRARLAGDRSGQQVRTCSSERAPQVEAPRGPGTTASGEVPAPRNKQTTSGSMSSEFPPDPADIEMLAAART